MMGWCFTVFSGLVIITILLFLVMIVAFTLIDQKNKRAVRARRTALQDLSNNIKVRYRMDVLNLCEALGLAEDIRTKLLMVGNNFFVYQPINEQSVSNLAFCLDKLSNSYAILQLHAIENDESSVASDKLASFIDMLPLYPRGYDAKFYTTSLMTISQLIELEADIEPVESEPVDVQQQQAQQEPHVNFEQGAAQQAGKW